MGMPLARHNLDPVHSRGQFYGSHAEAKLIALYLDFRSKHPEAVSYLGSSSRWDSRIINIDISKEPCRSCRELARSTYEQYQVMVNFTIQGRLDYPRCKNYYCEQLLRDGSRIFCATCQTQLTSLPMRQVYLPQMDTEEFHVLMRKEATRRNPCVQQQETAHELFQVVTKASGLGLHLYHENKVSETGLTVIVPASDTRIFRDAIEDRLESFSSPYGALCLTNMKECARKAMEDLFELLSDHDKHAPASSTDHGHIGQKLPPSSSPGRTEYCEKHVSTVTDVTHDLGRLFGMYL